MPPMAHIILSPAVPDGHVILAARTLWKLEEQLPVTLSVNSSDETKLMIYTAFTLL